MLSNATVVIDTNGATLGASLKSVREALSYITASTLIRPATLIVGRIDCGASKDAHLYAFMMTF